MIILQQAKNFFHILLSNSEIHFPGLCITHAQFSTYEPELFPALIYRMVLPRVVSYLQLHVVLLSVMLLSCTRTDQNQIYKSEKKPQILGR